MAKDDEAEKQHVPQWCMVLDCSTWADYFIDTEEGFTETLGHGDTPTTFYLCAEHMTQVTNDETGNYHHLRIDTGAIVEVVIGKYCCGCPCEVCDA